jgi:chromosome segregation ATPase
MNVPDIDFEQIKDFIKDRFDGVNEILRRMDSKLDHFEEKIDNQNQRITTLEVEMRQAKKDLDGLFAEDRQIKDTASQLTQKVTKMLAWVGGAGAVLALLWSVFKTGLAVMK